MDVEADGAQFDDLGGSSADWSACALLCQGIASLIRNRGGTSRRTLTPAEGTTGLVSPLVLGPTAGNTPRRGRVAQGRN